MLFCVTVPVPMLFMNWRTAELPFVSISPVLVSVKKKSPALTLFALMADWLLTVPVVSIVPALVSVGPLPVEPSIRTGAVLVVRLIVPVAVTVPVCVPARHRCAVVEVVMLKEASVQAASAPAGASTKPESNAVAP